jgi:hypothetical protein
MMKRLSIILFFLVLIPFNVFAQTIINYDFNNQSWGKLSKGSYWTMQPNGGLGNSPAARLQYSVSGTSGKALSLNTSSLKSNEFWIEMNVKMQGNVSGGCKFIKLFGSVSNHSQNNMTFGIDNWQNVQRETAYYRDTLCTTRWDGQNRGSCTPTAVVKSGPIDLRGGAWHHYKLWVKRASQGQSNGEVKVWHNGTLKSHIKNMNSNPSGSSTPFIEAIEFGGYNHHDTFNGNTWYLWIDNLYVGTTPKSGSGSSTTPVATPTPVTNPAPTTPKTVTNPAPAPAPTTPTPSNPINSGSIFQWSAPSYSVSEGVGKANFTIKRTGNTKGNASVRWGTYQNTAKVNEDYVGVSWTTINFTDGESSKNVFVEIIDDHIAEDDENFRISLSNPVNGSLGTLKDATVTIIDNDTPGTLAPPGNLKITGN